MSGAPLGIPHQKELDRTKDEFISVASHQLRTPLGSLRWNLELLLEQENLAPETRNTIQNAFDATLRMLNLVGDLLNVARIEQGRGQAPPSATDLIAVVEDAVEEMLPIAHKTKVTIDNSRLKHKSALTMIDAQRFREAIQNLLSNAVKYTPQGGTVTVKYKKQKELVTISISDTGLGIPEDEQSKLFSKFFRASNVTRMGTEGTGLGLFVVQSYVKSWGGKIWFESKLNHGTTFYLTVPLKKVVSPPAGAAKTSQQ